MSRVDISIGAYGRSLLPEAILLNAFVEPAPTQPYKPEAIRAREGHVSFKTLGTASLRAMAARPGLFDGRAVIVMGTEVYTLTRTGESTLLSGSVAGFSVADLDVGQDADLNSEAWCATGSALYRITTDDGAVEEAFPETDGAGASSVCCFRGYVIASEAGTDQVFVRIPGDTTWEPLSFISAEYAPDKVIAIRRLGEQVWFLGEGSAEAWALNDSATPPLAPYGGLVFDYGCRSRSAAISLPGALIWVDDACQVRMTQGGEPAVISTAAISEQLRQVSGNDLRGSWYQRDGRVFYILTLHGTATYVYDLTTRQWATRATAGDSYSRVFLYVQLGDVVLAGNSVTNEIYRLDADARDDDGDAFPVEFTAFASLPEGRVSCANIELICEVGNAPWNGAGSDPVIQMRYSDDNAKSWSGWRERSLGLAGQSRKRVRWNGLGMISAPNGRIFHFRVSDPVARRFSDLRMNVA